MALASHVDKDSNAARAGKEKEEMLGGIYRIRQGWGNGHSTKGMKRGRGM
jgi:hypothetical protein